jgi:hypothetical protein
MSSRDPSDMPTHAHEPEYRLTLRQADQARGDLYAISDELDFLKAQLSRLPDCAYVCRLALLATASIWVLIAAVALMFAR